MPEAAITIWNSIKNASIVLPKNGLIKSGFLADTMTVLVKGVSHLH
jgi:hypothetical protein